MSLLLSSATLLWRELTRFFRQKNRLIGALATPLLFWFIVGSGLGRSFHGGEGAGSDLSYLQYFLPGTMVLVCLFTAIFSTISIIEDRQAGFLQGVLVSPSPRLALVLGKMWGGAIMALLQSLVFILLSRAVHLAWSGPGILMVLGALFLLAFGLTGLGFVMAWKTDSIQGFHALMNLILMPLWLLSGALFPLSGAPLWLQRVMSLNPIYYGLSLVQRGLFPAGSGGTISSSVCWTVLILFSILMLGASRWVVGAGREK